MSKAQSLQDPFLNALRRERVPVSVYLVNGIKLQGTVESFDQSVAGAETGGGANGSRRLACAYRRALRHDARTRLPR